jgi:hypothetical protein
MATDGPQRFPRIRRKPRTTEAARAIASGDSCRTIGKQYEIAPSR